MRFIFLFFSLMVSLGPILKAQRADISDTLSSPVIVDVGGTFYSTPIKTCDNNVVIASHNKKMFLFNCEGEKINSFRTPGWIHATPTQLSDKSISIGCYDGHFYFFDKDGHFVKKIKPQGFIFTEPVEIGNYIAFGNNRGKVVFYDRHADKLSYTKLKGIVHGSPMVTSDSLLVIGSTNGKLAFINADREIVRVFKTDGWIMHSKPLETFDRSVIVGSYDKHLYALDNSGELKWKYKTEGAIHASPIQMGDSTIIFGSFDGYIYLLDQYGDLKHKIQTGKKVVSSPARMNDTVAVIGSYDKYLYFINTAGEILGKYYAGGKIFSSPIVLSCGTVFCSTTNGKLSFLPSDYISGMLNGKSQRDILWALEETGESDKLNKAK